MKYRNVKINGYDSKKEANRAFELRALEKIGKISNLQEQVKYELIPSQYEGNKCIERSCSYIADFVYLKNGNLVVEDTKGFKTTDYVIKRKLMLFIHGIRITEN